MLTYASRSRGTTLNTFSDLFRMHCVLCTKRRKYSQRRGASFLNIPRIENSKNFAYFNESFGCPFTVSVWAANAFSRMLDSKRPEKRISWQLIKPKNYTILVQTFSESILLPRLNIVDVSGYV